MDELIWPGSLILGLQAFFFLAVTVSSIIEHRKVRSFRLKRLNLNLLALLMLY